MLVLVIYLYIDSDTEFVDGQVVGEPTYFASGARLSVPPGATISVTPGATLVIAGILETSVESNITFLSSDPGQSWGGLRFERADAQVLRNLTVRGADIGIEIISSPDVHIEDSFFIENGTGVYLRSDDGVRSRVNQVADSEFRDNGYGIRASSTGLNATGNLFVGGGAGISLNGGSCGGGGACGYYSEMKKNRF